jgi:hypothetical protein
MPLPPPFSLPSRSKSSAGGTAFGPVVKADAGAARPERALAGPVLLLDVLAEHRDRAPPADPAKYEPDHSRFRPPVVAVQVGILLPHPSSRTRWRPAKTACRSLVTNTQWAGNVETQCRPVRMSIVRGHQCGNRVQLRYNYRLYPDGPQREALARAFGCARVVFNDALAARRAAHAAGEPYIPDAALSAALTASKQTPERAWLGEVSSVVLQQALADLNTAYRNFLASVTGKRKGPKVAPPRFRSRKDRRQAVRFTANSRFRVLGNGRLRLPPQALHPDHPR